MVGGESVLHSVNLLSFEEIGGGEVMVATAHTLPTTHAG